eukprot:CAMPEP_0116886382 /NCGR_PEP_ID=MMETSP0463-20121206/20209_1 /TAXON_ID=181622 /ORGANISM="Strombidinopsis sp, Strain SopsisLIS2011" /LENGTH=41 /DNA_ID= /DNA_START= /DNA_END= /DNA_ORIENTATION=
MFADDFEQLYRTLDLDDSGTIDRQEMAKFIQKMADVIVAEV